MNVLSLLQFVLPWMVTFLLAAAVLRGVVRAWRPACPVAQKTISTKATLTAGLLLGVVCAAGAAFFVFYGRRACPGASLEEVLRHVFPTSIDADHYIQLARYGYANLPDEQAAFHDQHLMIVFFPLWPLLIRVGTWLTGLDGYVVGLLLQPLLLGLAGAGLYRLIAPHFGEKIAAWTLVLLACMPGSFFFSAPMTESLYLALSVWALVCLEEDHPLGFAVLGLLTALTRSTGGLLGGVALVAAVLCWRQGKSWLRWLAAAVGPFGGTGLYLCMNYYYYGDWTAFSKIQASHWSQGLGWIGDTVRYMLFYVASWWESNHDFALYVSLFGVICIIGACLVLFCNRKQLPVCWLAYGVAYVLMAYGTTWLLSAPRYALSLPMLPLGAALVCKKDWQRALLAAVMGIVGIFYLREFLAWGPIY